MLRFAPQLDPPPAGRQRRRGATLAENRSLKARVEALEAELGRSAAQLAGLRLELRGAVQDALTDPLTGLANRRAFDLELAALGAAAGGSATAHLVMIDIDHFKRVNDAHGHEVGDAVLRIVGAILRANLRQGGLVARLGGDELGLLLPAAGPRRAIAIAGRLCRLLASRPLVLRDHPDIIARVTLSIGVAGGRAGESGACWQARADAALYEAKRRGGNCIAIARRLDVPAPVVPAPVMPATARAAAALDPSAERRRALP
jgi:diguanylate cyclase